MTKLFSVASWNVENFRGDPSRVTRVVEFLQRVDPDIFALYEVVGSQVFQTLTTRMPDYTFHITEGPQVQEILLGVRSGITAFFTQKVEFRAGVSLLRPGALLTITVDGKHYPLLFLHTKSGNDPRGLGLRDDMLVRSCKFRRSLDVAAGGSNMANYIFMGDLNIMGMKYTHVREEDIEPANELLRLKRLARYRHMSILDKDASATWWNGSDSYIPSNLDHVVAADHLEFKTFDSGAKVEVRGWPKKETIAEKRDWIDRYSDHGLMYFELVQQNSD
jgi:endonuclease/exonuclease/phosphatase family metal-dependent hydrolase